VVQYSFEDLAGGIQRYVKDLSNLQIKEGHQVEVFAAGKKNPSLHSNLHVKKFGGFEVFRTPICPGMLIKFLFHKYDLVHIHAQFPVIAELISLLCQIKKVPLVTTYHNEPDLCDQSFFKKFLGFIWEKVLASILLRCSDAIIVTTDEFLRSSLILRNFNEKVCVIPCGIVLEKSWKNSRKTNIPSVLYVGRIKPEKGLHILIQAMVPLRQALSDAILLIVGEATRNEEQVYLYRLHSLINKLGLKNSVKFMGRVTDKELKKIYKKSSVLVLPSITRLEAFGIVQLEAMAHGLPVVVSDIPGPRSVLKDAALIVPPKSPEALYRALLRILADERFAQTIIVKGKLVVTEYQWSSIYKKIMHVYEDVMRMRKPRYS